MRNSKPAGVSLLGRWASFTVHHRWIVLIAAVLIVASMGLLYRSQHGDFVSSIDVPGAESQAAVDLLRERMSDRAGDSAFIVIQSEAGLESPDVRPDVEALATEVQSIPGVVAVASPYASSTMAMSPDGTIGYILV